MSSTGVKVTRPGLPQHRGCEVRGLPPNRAARYNDAAPVSGAGDAINATFAANSLDIGLDRATHPRHLRPALRQWPHPHWPFGGVHPDRYLGAIPEARGQPLRLFLCRRHARHGGHDQRPAGRRAAKRSSSPDASGSRARLRRVRYRIRQLRQHAQRRKPRALRGVLGGDPQGGTRQRARRRAALRSRRPARSCADRFVRGTCPKCKSPDQPGDNCSQVRPSLQPDRPHRPA